MSNFEKDLDFFINDPLADGYTHLKMIEKYGDKFEEEMKKRNGWNRKHKIQQEWMDGAHGYKK